MKKILVTIACALLVPLTNISAETFGITDIGSTQYPGVVKYNAAGIDYGDRLNIDSNGNVYLVGRRYSSSADWFVSKYTSDGELDTSWASSGLIHHGTVGFDQAAGIVFDDVGGSYVGGTISTNGNDIELRRYDENGDLDTSWGSSGSVTYNSGAGSDLGLDMAQSEDAIYIGGTVGTNGVDYAVLKYNFDGTLDTDWGTSGVASYNSGGTQYDQGLDIAVDNDGSVFLVGFSNVAGNGYDSVVVKFDNTGTLDGDWGSGGAASYNSGGTQNDFANGVMIGADGVYVFGYQSTNSNDAFILRYDASGVLDADWGTAGVYLYSTGGDEIFNGGALDGEGNVYAIGRAASGGDDGVIARLDSLGVLDTDWGTGGFVTFDAEFGEEDLFNRVLFEDGKLIVGGSFSYGDGRAAGVIRYTIDGVLDIGFGNTPVKNFPSGYVLGSKATLNEEAQSLDSVSIYAEDEIATTTLAIYDNAFNLIWESDEIVSATTDDWLTVSIASGTPATLTDVPAGDYYLAFQLETTDAVPTFTRGDDEDGFFLPQAYGAFPDPIDPILSNVVWSVYATYTPVPAPDEIAPIIDTLSPADNATDVAIDTNLVVTFDETVVASSTGNILLYTVGDVLVETIPANDEQVTIDDAEVTISLSADLDYEIEYYVLVDEGAFEDEAGNQFEGITASTTWNFTTLEEEVEEESGGGSGGGGGGGSSGGGGGGGSRKTAATDDVVPLIIDINNTTVEPGTIEYLMEQLIMLLMQLLEQLLAERQA